MKQKYSFGNLKLPSPLGPKQKKYAAPKPGIRKKREFHFKDLTDTPPKVKFRRQADGFRIHTRAPNYGKAAGTLIPIIIAGYIAIYGPDLEKTNPFLPRLVCGIIIGLFLLGGIYQLLRNHELEIKGDGFRISSGLGFLRFYRKGKLKQIKSAWVDNKIRSLHTGVGDGEESNPDPTDGSRNKFFYLAVRLKDNTIWHTLEGSPDISLQYISFALRTAVEKNIR
jgi:hypothetical protein